MKTKLSLKRVGLPHASNSVLFIDKENKTMMFFGNKTEYIKSVIAWAKDTLIAEKTYLDLLTIFNLYQEVTEQELLEQGYFIMMYSDKSGTYHIEASLSSEEPVSISKTVLRTYKLQA